jgi:anti-anti-sigma factor
MASNEDPAGRVELEQHAGGVSVVRLIGEHDLATIAEVRAVIESAVAADQGVVVSLAETTFIDSGPTRALFMGNALLRVMKRRLVLHVPTASIVRQVLEIRGLSTALPVTSSLETAVGLAGATEGEPLCDTG